jgi:hypothetical protein
MPSTITKEKYLEILEKNKEKQLLESYKAALRNIKKQLKEIDDKGRFNNTDMLRLNQLQKLQLSINKEIMQLSEKTGEVIKESIKEQYKHAFQFEAFNIEKEVNRNIGFTLIPNNQIDVAVLNTLDKVGFLKRNDRNTIKLIFEINTAIASGLIAGDDYATIASILDGKFDIGYYNAKRIVRTEGHRVRENGTQNSYEQAESKGLNITKVWLAAVDERTRESHAQADGQEVNIDEAFIVDGEELMHPGDPSGSAENVINCRCTTRANVRLPNEEKNIKYTEYNGADSYEEWLDKKI